jgi:uncharacterized protein with HEPN domain
LSSKADPTDCLRDIVDNIARIESYVVGMSRDSLANDVRTQDAVERCLERICEAVSRLGRMAAVLLPGHPSAAIRGMGNRLRHAYDRIDLGLIWDTIATDLPSLKADAERALASLRARREDL